MLSFAVLICIKFFKIYKGHREYSALCIVAILIHTVISVVRWLFLKYTANIANRELASTFATTLTYPLPLTYDIGERI